MPDVEFTEETEFGRSRISPSPAPTPKLVRLIMQTGIVRDARGANYVLIGIAIVASLAAVFIFASIRGTAGRTAAPQGIPGGAAARLAP